MIPKMLTEMPVELNITKKLRYMKLIWILICSFLGICCGKFSKADSPQLSDQYNMPDFSWETVPVCIHLYKDELFSEQDIEFISRFPIMCIEKAHGGKSNVFGLEFNTRVETVRLLEANPKQKVLFYWNSCVDYGDMYEADEFMVGTIDHNDSKSLRKEGLHPEWALKDKNGNYIGSGGGLRCHFDISIADVKQWWLSIPKSVISKDGVNGIFIDKVLQYSMQSNINKLGEAKFNQLHADYIDMMTQLRRLSPNNTLLISNALRGTDANKSSEYGKEHLTYCDGAMLEHFCSLSGADKDVIVRDIQLIQDCATMGKVVIVKGWPSFNWTDANYNEIKNDPVEFAKLSDKAKEEIVFPLAAYLVAAGRYSYFCYSWGYEYSEGGMIDYPEYSKPLGKPLNQAQKNGYVYTRNFEHASVWVDVENRKGRIDWK